MSRKRNGRPGDIYRAEDGEMVRLNDYGEEELFVPHPHEVSPEYKPDALDVPIRADGTVAPFYPLDEKQLEKLDQDTPRGRRTRHDGWTKTRQRDFIERLAASASVSDAARYVGMSRQSARDLYNRSAPFRAAWDEALRAAVSVLAETAFDRAVNGTQEQVWYKGQMVGFREKYNDRLLMFLLRVRDPMNFAPLDDLAGWQRQRALEPPAGTDPALARLAEAPPAAALPHPYDRLSPEPPAAGGEQGPPKPPKPPRPAKRANKPHT